MRPGPVSEQVLKGGFDRAFVFDTLITVGLQRLVVSLDRLMGWLDGRRLAHALGLGEGNE
jgi:hypothetical protein